MTSSDQPTSRELTRYTRLAAEAADAAQLRALMLNPDVVALRVEKIRSQVDALLAAAIYIGLGFTMSNVQAFAAQNAPTWSITWWSAWLLDPIPSLALLAILRAEKITARYQLALPVWAKRTKWLAFTATYVMNTWTSWGLSDQPLSWSGIVLHSVPPLVVLFAAEAGPGVRDRLTEAVHRALLEAQNTARAVADRAPAHAEPDAAAAERTSRPTVDPACSHTDARPEREAEATATTTARSAIDEDRVELLEEPDTVRHELDAVLPALLDDRPDENRNPAPPSAMSATPTDTRVQHIQDRLADGETHTGDSVAELFGVSPRTGRRILRAAEAHHHARQPPPLLFISPAQP